MGDIKLTAAICPRCGASLEIPGDLDRAHCVYCGTKIIIGGGGDKVECKICEGFGKVDVCKACNGSGTCDWSRPASSIRNNELLTFISFGSGAYCENGICSACNGSGTGGIGITCPFCDGSGKCPKCYGTGKCPACRGIGFIAGPTASQKCGACNGTGLLDVKDYSGHGSDRCSVCMKPMPADMFFCSFCGHGRACPRCKNPWPKGAASCPKCGFRKGGQLP